MRRALPALLATVVVVAAGCGDGGSATPPPTTLAADPAAAPTSTPSAPAEAGSPTTTAPIAPSAAQVAVGPGTSATGPVLVDERGRTLYVRLDDPAGQSTCTDLCARGWPPFSVPAVVAGTGVDPALVGILVRPDGTPQVAVAGRATYRFAGDLEAGDALAQGFNGTWRVLGPDGQPVTPPARP